MHVCPHLIDLSFPKKELPLTLNQFHVVMADQPGTRKLVSDVCKVLARKSGLAEADAAAGKMWARLGARLGEVQDVSGLRPGTSKDIVYEGRRLTSDFEKVRGLIDAHESNIVGKLSPWSVLWSVITGGAGPSTWTLSTNASTKR